MKRRAGLLLLVALAAAVPVRAQNGGGGGGGDSSGDSGYAIDGIAVDVAASSPEVARMTAFRIAQRKAWAMLWTRLTGSAAGGAPHLSDSQLDSIVAGIESQGERFSMTRYIATLGVVFDRSRSAAFLGGAGAGATLQSPPMLLLPLFDDGGVRMLYQAKTPWRAAWQRFRGNVTPVDYVLASGSAGDNLLLTSWQVTRADRPGWRNILNRFDTVDVLTAEARLTRTWPGGPVRGLFIARHGPDATELARFALASADEAGIPAMLDQAVRRLDAVYTAALRDGRLQSEPDLTADLAPIMASAPTIGALSAGGEEGSEVADAASLEALVATPDAATASAIEAQLRGAAGVTGVTTTSLSLGGSSRLLITYLGSRAALAYALDGRGLRLVTENGETVLRRRRDGDAPLPPPADAPALPAPAAPALPPATAPVSGEVARRPHAPATPAPPPARAPARPPEHAPIDLLPKPSQ